MKCKACHVYIGAQVDTTVVPLCDNCFVRSKEMSDRYMEAQASKAYAEWMRVAEAAVDAAYERNR